MTTEAKQNLGVGSQEEFKFQSTVSLHLFSTRITRFCKLHNTLYLPLISGGAKSFISLLKIRHHICGPYFATPQRLHQSLTFLEQICLVLDDTCQRLLFWLLWDCFFRGASMLHSSCGCNSHLSHVFCCVLLKTHCNSKSFFKSAGQFLHPVMCWGLIFAW